MTRALLLSFALTAAAAGSAAAQTCWGVPLAKPGVAAAGGIGLWGAQAAVLVRPPGPFVVRGSHHWIGVDDVAVEPTASVVGVAAERRRGRMTVCAVGEIGRLGREERDTGLRVSGTIRRAGVGIAWTAGSEAGWRVTAYAVPQYNDLETRTEQEFLFGPQTTTRRTGTLGLEWGVMAHRRHWLIALAGGRVPFDAEPEYGSGPRLLLRTGLMF